MKTRNLFWQIPLLIVISAPAWWNFAAKALDPHAKIVPRPSVVDKRIVMDGVRLTQIRHGVTEFVVHASHLTSKRNQKEYLLQNVSAELLSTNEKITISSSEALYETKQEVVTLLGNVHLENNAGMQLDTSVLRFLSKYKKIKSAAPLKVSSQNFKVSGISFYYDLNSEDFRVGKRVVCEIL